MMLAIERGWPPSELDNLSWRAAVEYVDAYEMYVEAVPRDKSGVPMLPWRQQSMF